jgi:hypothetical protein
MLAAKALDSSLEKWSNTTTQVNVLDTWAAVRLVACACLLYAYLLSCFVLIFVARLTPVMTAQYWVNYSTPWKRKDGFWYSSTCLPTCVPPLGSPGHHSADLHCGATALLYRSKTLFKDSDWAAAGVLFASNNTIQPGLHPETQFITPDYAFGLPGDPRGGETFVFIATRYGSLPAGWPRPESKEGPIHQPFNYVEMWVGTEQNTSEGRALFLPDRDTANTAFDWGSFRPDASAPFGITPVSAPNTGPDAPSLAKSISSPSGTGRHVMLGWLANVPVVGSVVSLARDISLGLGADGKPEIEQRFVPELQQLRSPEQAVRLRGKRGGFASAQE